MNLKRNLLLILMFVMVGCGDLTTNSNDISDSSIVISKIEKPAILVSVDSASPNSVALDWLPAKGSGIGYEVHLSEEKDFIPDSSTLQLTTNETSVIVNSLAEDTKYYAKVVTITTNEQAISNQLYVTTPNIVSKIKKNIQIKELNISSTTNNLQQKSSGTRSSITDNKLITAEKLSVGEVIYSTGEEPYLRKVVETKVDSTGNSVATTEELKLRDIYEDLSFSTSLKLVDMEESVNRSSSSSFQTSIAHSSTVASGLAKISPSSGQNIQTITGQWKSGLVMSSAHYTETNSSKTITKPSAVAYKTEADSEDYFSGSIDDNLVVKVGDTFDHKIDIVNLNKRENYEFDGTSEDSDEEIQANRVLCESHGGTFWDDGNDGLNDDSECKNMPVQICSISASADIKKPENVDAGNQPRIEMVDNVPYIKWTPTTANIDYDSGEPYELDIDVDITPGVFCGTSNQDTFFGDTIDLNNIKVQAVDTLLDDSVKLSESEKNVIFEKDGLSISNVFVADFSPTIEFDAEISATALTKGHASLRSELVLGDKLDIEATIAGKHIFDPKPIYSKKFVKVVQAGVVPVVIVGRLRLMAVAELEAEGALTATVDIDSELTMDLAIDYNTDTGEWEVTNNKSFTYNINAGGKGSVKATGTVKIIPSLELSLYEVVATHFLVEPYLYATIGLQGEINANISQDIRATFDSSVQFTDLEAGIGLDMKVYAGPAWNSSDDWIDLAWPEGAIFASSALDNDNFMGAGVTGKLKTYYENTNTYKTFHPLDKSKVLGIPSLDYSVDSTTVPPLDINSRAIKLIAECTPVDNILHPLGKKNYITCAEWQSELVTNNFQLTQGETTQNKTDFWLTPLAQNGSYPKNQLRLVNNSSLGWARQYLNVEYTTVSSDNDIPNYWKERYSLTSATEDKDGDGFSNLEEFEAGTNPDNPNDYPSTTGKAPYLFLVGGNPLTISKDDNYTEFGAIAGDNEDGDLSDTILIVTNTVDTSTVGDYKVVYFITDSDGNSVQTTRVVKVVEESDGSDDNDNDFTPPSSTITIKPYNVYDEDGNYVKTVSTFYLYGVYDENIIIEGGTVYVDGYAKVNGNFIQSGGAVNINGGKLIVKGDYRIQKPTEDGNYTYSAGYLVMQK
ncbi:DUF5011 domain-containing protein, partial [bacterium]|nr:DUF5011 domain-containing protein [bacterium]MBU1957435.1 DUF5011 domain-containing protein [bacterium]